MQSHTLYILIYSTQKRGEKKMKLSKTDTAIDIWIILRITKIKVLHIHTSLKQKMCQYHYYTESIETRNFKFDTF